MKTYTETTEKPLLQITYEDFPENPREWTNIGKFIVISSRYDSPDRDEKLMDIIIESGQEATRQQDHITKIREILEDEGEKVILIVPIFRHEHGSVSYSLGSSSRFDISNDGFYIVTEKTLNEVGVENDDSKILEAIQGEIEIYNKYVNGEVYQFTLYNEEGEIEDSCGGFYNIEDIKEFLPKEWQEEDIENYFINQ